MSRRVVLVTGFPTSFLALRVLRQLLRDEPETEFRCVVKEKSLERATTEISRLAPNDRDRIRVLVGDVVAMDMGLSGDEYRGLAGEVNVIHNCAAVTYLNVTRETAESVNVDGAREVLELSDVAPHLERLVHWSTALVSGKRRGFLLEEELTDKYGFRNVVEETRFRGERIIRAEIRRLPITILRPSIVVGDSKTGEIDRFEGPYLLALLMLNSPVDLRLPVPRRGDTPLHLVPIDYVVEAGLRIAASRASLGKTFHIVDPDPLPARRVFELLAENAGRPVPRNFLPTNLATAILRTPGVERVAQAPRAFLEQLATEVAYDDRNTRQALEGTGVQCPSFASYASTLIAYVRAQQSERRRKHAEREIHGEHAVHNRGA